MALITKQLIIVQKSLLIVWFTPTALKSVWAVLKRGYNGTFHNISTKHLSCYIDEFVFKLNEGNCQTNTKDRMVSLFKGIGNNRISYKELTA